MAKRPITDTPTIPTKDRGSHRERRTEHEEVAPARRPARPRGPPTKQRRNGKDSPRGSNAAREEHEERDAAPGGAAQRRQAKTSRLPARTPESTNRPRPNNPPPRGGTQPGQRPRPQRGGTRAPWPPWTPTRGGTPHEAQRAEAADGRRGSSRAPLSQRAVGCGREARRRHTSIRAECTGAASTTPTHVSAHGSAHTRQGATRHRM